MAQVKGTAIQSSMRYLRERFGEGMNSAHSLCVHRGDPVCRFEGNWE